MAGTAALMRVPKDKASEWLNQNSAGTGPYMLTRWERNSQIELKQNSNYWRKPAGFERSRDSTYSRKHEPSARDQAR